MTEPFIYGTENTKIVIFKTKKLSKSRFIKLTWPNSRVLYANSYAFIGEQLRLRPRVVCEKLSPSVSLATGGVSGTTHFRDPLRYGDWILAEYYKRTKTGDFILC
jgi:hypothetical protein